MKFTRKYGGTEVTLDTNEMTEKQKFIFFSSVAIGSFAKGVMEIKKKMTEKESRSSKSRTKKTN